MCSNFIQDKECEARKRCWYGKERSGESSGSGIRSLKEEERYYELFATFVKHPEVESVTFWGSHDGRSWLNNFPVIGRTNYPLLFDRELQKKAAYYAAIEALSEGDESSEQAIEEEAAE